MISKIFITLLLTLLIFNGCNKKDESKENSVSKNNVEKNSSKTTKSDEQNQSQNKSKNILKMLSSDDKEYKLIADYNGLKFEGFEGKIIILDFFATWCPPCKMEIPHLVNLQKKYKDKIQIFSVLMEQNRDNLEIEEFKKEFDINYPILNSKENFFLSQALGGIRSLPTIVVYDKSGAYFQHYLGAVPEEILDETIQKALKK